MIGLLLTFKAARGEIVGSSDAAKLAHGVHASIAYQQQKDASGTNRKIDVAMAPVFQAVKLGLIKGVDVASLVAMHDVAYTAAMTDTRFITNNLTPQQQLTTIIGLLKDTAKGDLVGLIADLGSANLLAAANQYGFATSARDRVIQPLQPSFIIQQQINNYYLQQMGEIYDLAASNSYVAQNFDQIFSKDLGVSIRDDARAVLNKDLNLPDYFRTHVNGDGSLSIDITGLHLVYADQSQRLTQASSNAIDIAKFVDQAQRKSLLNNGSLRDILQSVPADVQAQQKLQYEKNQQIISSAGAGISLVANLVGFIDPKVAREMSVVGGSAVQMASAINGLALGSLGMTGSLIATGNIVGGALAIYNLFKAGPTSDQIILDQLRVIGQQINQLRTEMNSRFDILDKNLNILYQTINTRFDKLDFDVQSVIKQLTTLQGDLNRFERNFYDLTLAGFLRELDDAITHGIGYRDTFGFNMTGSQFSGFESTFYGWALLHALDLAKIPGARDYSDQGVYKELAHPPVQSDLSFFPDSANINYFAQYLSVRFGLLPFPGAPLPNPSVWAIAARCHYQLACENPAFDATLNPLRLNDIISRGVSIQQALRYITSADSAGAHPLFDNLVANYRAKLTALQKAIDDLELAYRNSLIQQASQDVSSKLLAGCDGKPIGIAIPNILVPNVPTPFLAAHKLGLGQVAPCVSEAQWTNVRIEDVCPFGIIKYATLSYSIDMFYGATLLQRRHAKSVEKTINFNLLCSLPTSDLTPIDYLKSNWTSGDNLKARFDSQSEVAISPPLDGLVAAISSQVDQSGNYQKPLYQQIVSGLQNGGSLYLATTELAGMKAIIEKYVLIGMPHSVASSDYLRMLLYGTQRLPGRTAGPLGDTEDIVADYYGPALNSLANQSSQPKLNVASIVNPRIDALQSILKDILARVDNKQLVESDDTIDSTLQTLQSFRDSKLANRVDTQPGSNVTVKSPRGVTVNYAGVFSKGITVVTPTDPGSASTVPGGFILTPQIAFDVNTDVVFSGPITTCFTVPSINDATTFSNLVVFHSEGSSIVDRTFSRDFTTRTICAKTDSLSPFTVALKKIALPCASDVSSQVTIGQGGYRLNRATGRLVQDVTVQNTGTTPIPGAMLLQIQISSGNAALFNSANNLFACQSSTCPAVALVDLGPSNILQPGASVKLTLEFTYSGSASIAYSTHVLAACSR